MELVLAVFVFGDWLSGFWSYSLIHMYFFYKEFRSDSKGFGIVNNCCLINTSRLIAKTLQSNSASLISASHLWHFFLYWILDSAGCHLVAFLILSWNCWSTATISLFGGNLNFCFKSLRFWLDSEVNVDFCLCRCEQICYFNWFITIICCIITNRLHVVASLNPFNHNLIAG